MATDDLGVPDKAALLALMSAAQEVSNRELAELAGFRLSGAPLRKLWQRDLVSSRKEGQMWVHELTDKGWRWCADELAQPPPGKGGSAQGALYAVLGGLRRYLDRSGLTLADMFGEAPAAGPALAEAPTVAAATPTPGDGSLAAVITQVRGAYRQLSPGSADWVRIADLRASLASLPSRDVDTALQEMSRARVANLVPQANQRLLTEADWAAAVRIGNDDCHLIWLEEA